LVGHDWGAPIVWNTALFFPQVVRAVAGLSVPYTGRGPMPRIELFRNLYKDRFFYQIYFQEPGVAEAELEADVRSSLRKIYYWGSGEGRKAGPQAGKSPDAKYLDGLTDPDPFPGWLTPDDQANLNAAAFAARSIAIAPQNLISSSKHRSHIQRSSSRPRSLSARSIPSWPSCRAST
jgi:pimeloyl-ACP methyl ester carboxylesterase